MNLFKKEQKQPMTPTIIHTNTEAIAELRSDVKQAVPAMNFIMKHKPFKNHSELYDHRNHAHDIVEDLYCEKYPMARQISNFKIPLTPVLKELEETLLGVKESVYKFTKFENNKWVEDTEKLDAFILNEYDWVLTTPEQESRYKTQQVICEFLNSLTPAEQDNLFRGIGPIWKMIRRENDNAIGDNPGAFIPVWSFPFADLEEDNLPREFEKPKTPIMDWYRRNLPHAKNPENIIFSKEMF